MLKKDLPLIEYKIDPSNGSFVNCISLVEYPAIESDFIAFSNHKDSFETNDEKRELLGLAMIPEKPIYRNNENGGEYMGTFSKATIREISQIYALNGFFTSMNIEHSVIPAESYIFQSYLVDEAKGIQAPNGIKAPDGSWVIGVKVQSDRVWENIKAGKIKGFSVEGIFKLIDTKTTVKLSDRSIPIYDIQFAMDDLMELEKLMNIIGRS